MNNTAATVGKPSWEELLIQRLTRENWLRYRFAIELAVAAGYLLVALWIMLDFGSVVVLHLVVTLLLAGGIALHRVRPILAVCLAGFAILAMSLLGVSFGFGLTLWAPLFIVVLGSSLYGAQVTRISGLVLVLLGGALAASNAFYFTPSLGTLFRFVLTSAVLGIPWLAGALLRLALSRRTLGESVVATASKLNAAEHDVSIEQERNRVARDVHDIVAHSLAVVIAQADGARYAARNSSPAVDEALTTIATTAREALIDVRALLTELRHSQERGPQPGMNDLDALVRGFRESGLEIDWSSYGASVPVSESTGLAVYRVMQESLTNALRHGGRTHPVDIEFDWTETALAVTVTNDVAEGERTVNHAGHGIPGMHERATLAGGTFSAADGTNGRFRVRATFPIDRLTARTQPVTIMKSEALGTAPITTVGR